MGRSEIAAGVVGYRSRKKWIFYLIGYLATASSQNNEPVLDMVLIKYF